VFDGTVDRVEGVVLVLAYAMYFVSLVYAERKHSSPSHEMDAGRWPAPVEIGVGLVVVTFGAHLAVTGGVELAAMLGITQTLLGVILIAAGTSLPELALSVRAASQRRASMSVGNVVGSNIFDLLVPVGVASAIHPLSVQRGTILFDLPALALFSVVLLVFLLRRKGLQRHEAMALIGLYVLYTGIRVVTGFSG
jgi:cation:H+ antiporter